jgi:8-oxo-dGTP diphosphatase
MIEGLPPDLGYTDYDTRLAAYAVVVEDRRILLAWWNGEGVAEPCWTLPGGGVDLAETPEEGAVREVLEETCHHVALTGLLTVHSLAIRPERRTASTARWLRAVRAVYAAEVTGGTLGTVEVGGTTDRADWVDLDELRGLPHTDIVAIGLAAHDARHPRS